MKTVSRREFLAQAAAFTALGSACGRASDRPTGREVVLASLVRTIALPDSRAILTHSKALADALQAAPSAESVRDGVRCSARSRLQFHHKLPYERGGPTSTDNLELMCSAHNTLLAERDYGRSFIVHVRRARSHTRSPHARDPERDSEHAHVANGDPCSQ